MYWNYKIFLMIYFTYLNKIQLQQCYVVCFVFIFTPTNYNYNPFSIQFYVIFSCVKFQVVRLQNFSSCSQINTNSLRIWHQLKMSLHKLITHGIFVRFRIVLLKRTMFIFIVVFLVITSSILYVNLMDSIITHITFCATTVILVSTR